MNSKILMGAAAAVVVGLGGAYYALRDGSAPEREPIEARENTATEAPELPAPETPADPAVRHPIPERPEAIAQEAPLPPLNESDASMVEALTGVAGRESVTSFLIPMDVIRRTVATIDGLPRGKVAVRMRPVMPTEGRFATTTDEAGPLLDEANYARYAPFVRAVQAADAGELAALYFRFYPLFQQAYEDLGYPGAYFNDRVVEVIDHLLETPQIEGPIRLQRPHVLYEFADPELEMRSAGQKLLIRMGPENAAAVKAKLREIRSEISASDER